MPLTPLPKLPLALCALAAASCGSPTVNNADTILVGAEVQAYPAGVIPGLHIRKHVSPKDAINVRVAANITDRQDFGERDDETGDGFGAGIGWRHSFAPLGTDGAESHRWPDSWFYGLRLDAWDLSIDWKDPGREGTTDIIVLQPSAEFGYGWSRPSFGRLEASLGLGAEINVDTDGEDVGEGAILLFGLTWLP